MIVGERIKLRRMELGMTQYELADRLGYSNRSSIAKLETRDDIPAKRLSKIAQVLEIEPQKLLGIEKLDFKPQTSKRATLTHILFSDKEMIDFLDKFYSADEKKQKATSHYDKSKEFYEDLVDFIITLR